MDDCHRAASAKPSDLRKAELRRHPCTNKLQVTPTRLSSSSFSSGWTGSSLPAAFLLGHCPPPAVTPGESEVTLRADPVAMNKSEGLWTEEPQLHSDLWKRSRRRRLSQFLQRLHSDFWVFFQYFDEFLLFFSPFTTSPENSLKFIFYPLSF